MNIDCSYKLKETSILPYLNYYLFHVIYCLFIDAEAAKYQETVYVSWLLVSYKVTVIFSVNYGRKALLTIIIYFASTKSLVSLS